jgi:hypothetical protein
MHSRRQLYERTVANRVWFQKALSDATLSAKTDHDQLVALEVAARFAAGTGTGLLRSSYLEQSLNRFASKFKTTRPPSRRGVLHVFSTPYEAGGHTRVVERWILSDKFSVEHSIVVTEPVTREISVGLTRAVAGAGGQVFIMDLKQDVLERAFFLRSLAQRFDFVILHTHMHDVVPTIAFGVESFEVPVIFFNHADHRFSVGMSIASLIAETRSWGAKRSAMCRGIANPFVLGIPSATPNSVEAVVCRGAIRDELGIPRSSRVVICSAAPHKFMPYASWNVFALLERLLRSSPDVWILLAGLERNSFRSMSGEALRSRECFRRLVFLPVVPETEFRRYVSCADFGIDTIPEGGCTTLIDYINSGVPVVCHAPVTSQMDYLVDTADYVLTEDAFIDRCGALVESDVHRNVRLQSQKSALLEETQRFPDRLRRMYELSRSSPKIGFQKHDVSMVSDVDLLLTQQSIC